jgi:hypothetical protein
MFGHNEYLNLLKKDVIAIGSDDPHGIGHAALSPDSM